MKTLEENQRIVDENRRLADEIKRLREIIAHHEANCVCRHPMFV